MGVPSHYSYIVRPTDEGRFEVVCEQDGTIHSTHEDEEWAEFCAEESYCDDAVMIRHEAEH